MFDHLVRRFAHRRFLLPVVTIAVICAIVCFDSFASISKRERAAVTSAGHSGEQVLPTSPEFARLMLLAGQAQRAKGIFSNCNFENHDPDWPSPRLAFYLGLCCDRLGQRAEALAHYRRCSAAVVDEGSTFFECLCYQAGGIRPFSSSLAAIPGAAIDASAIEPLNEINAQLRKAKTDFEANNSIENQIRLASWLLMFAEVASDDNHGAFVTNAIDAFNPILFTGGALSA